MKRLCMTVAALVVTTPAWADICVWNSKATAEAAAYIFEPGDAILTFCAPCGDKTAVSTTVKTKSIMQADPADADSQQVLINGEAIDLAYTYVCKTKGSKECSNVGRAVQCTDDPDVPDPLPPSAIQP